MLQFTVKEGSITIAFQCVALQYSVVGCRVRSRVCCSVLQCGAVCRSVLRCVLRCVLQGVLQCVALCRSVLQCNVTYRKNDIQKAMQHILYTLLPTLWGGYS